MFAVPLERVAHQRPPGCEPLTAAGIDQAHDAPVGVPPRVRDEVEAMVINVDRKNRSISLSIKAKDSVETAEAMQRIQAETGA